MMLDAMGKSKIKNQKSKMTEQKAKVFLVLTGVEKEFRIWVPCSWPPA